MAEVGDGPADEGRDYVTCFACAFVGTVPHGGSRCPDCGSGRLYPMTESERRSWDDGTLTRPECCFDNMCQYTSTYRRAERDQAVRDRLANSKGE
jgi:hypothetical protein